MFLIIFLQKKYLYNILFIYIYIACVLCLWAQSVTDKERRITRVFLLSLLVLQYGVLWILLQTQFFSYFLHYSYPVLSIPSLSDCVKH